MSHAFKPGDRVEVIAGPRAGEVTTVASELVVTERLTGDLRVLPAEPVHYLALRSFHDGTCIVSPPRWLRPFHINESTGPLTAEQLRKLCGVKEVEDA